MGSRLPTRGGQVELTEENKAIIDSRTYKELLAHWRYASAGDPWFQGKTGKYWSKRMKELRDADPAGAITASKQVGWG